MTAGEALSNADTATRVATGKLIVDSAAYTTEVSIFSVSPLLTAGKTYAIWVSCRVSISAASNEIGQLRIREDSVSGTQLNIGQYFFPTTSGTGWTCTLYAEYTALTTATKAFHLTAQRVTAGANHQVRATGNAPAWLLVDLLPD